MAEICDPKDVALAALTNLIRLMGAELVAGRHRDDVGRVEQAVRSKIVAVTVLGCPAAVADEGVALARSHVERALIEIRAQSVVAHAADLASAATRQQPAMSTRAITILH